jgi:hypothetical protein
MNDTTKRNIAIIFAVVFFSGLIVFLSKNSSLLYMNDLNKRNDGNDRTEIHPKMNTRVNGKRKYQPTLTPITNKVFENFQPTFQPTPLPPSYRNVPKDKLSTFCQCSSISEQICADPATYVNSYNSGLTESSTFKNKNWSDIMPYDQYIQQPNYYKQNTEWADGMPYSIYYDKK